MRLYYSHVGSPFVDIEWDEEAVIKYKNRIANIYKMIHQIKELEHKEDKNLDKWLESSIQRSIKKIIDAFDNYDLRVATNEIYFECPKNLNWYLKRGGCNKKIFNSIIKIWIKLMTPITPHIAEELWSIDENNFVSNENFPSYNPIYLSEKEEIGEYLLNKVIEDISEILKVIKIKPNKIYIYTTQNWKSEIHKKAIKFSEEKN